MTPGSAEVSGLTNGFLTFLIHRLLLIMFGRFYGGLVFELLLLRGGRIADCRAAGHGEQEHGKDYRRPNGHGTLLLLSVLGVVNESKT